MVPLFLRFVYEGILVRQVAPDPFLPVKQKTDYRLIIG